MVWALRPCYKLSLKRVARTVPLGSSSLWLYLRPSDIPSLVRKRSSSSTQKRQLIELKYLISHSPYPLCYRNVYALSTTLGPLSPLSNTVVY
jgi:hypothetical protein